MTGSASRLTGFFVPVHNPSKIGNSAHYICLCCKKFVGISNCSLLILINFLFLLGINPNYWFVAEFATNIPVICLESETFKALVMELAKEIREDELDPFIDEKEAMRLLRITSKTTFQKYRDSRDIDWRSISK